MIPATGWTCEVHELSEGFSAIVYDEHGQMLADHLDEDRALLIAAAPELLAALQAVVANSDRLQEAGHRRRGDLNKLYDAAVSALAKATPTTARCTDALRAANATLSQSSKERRLVMGDPTPGPWRVEEGTVLIWGACDPDDNTTYGMGYPVAECRGSGWGSSKPSIDAMDANARLISTAPELLEAATEAEWFLAHYSDYVASVPVDEMERHPYLPDLQEKVEMLRAAIAKALGRTPNGETE